MRVRQEMTLDDDALDLFPEEFLGKLHLTEQVIRLNGQSFGWGGFKGMSYGIMFNGGKEEEDENEDDNLSGGSQRQRDNTIYRYPDEFRRWYHREIKPDVYPGRDATPEELAEAFQDWLDQGQPTVKSVDTGILMTAILYGLYEGVKWTAAALLAPETLGASLGAAAIIP